ncbi:MAG: hypothetical protein ACOCP1_00055, partial [Campylobacterales bacterium]
MIIKDCTKIIAKDIYIPSSDSISITNSTLLFKAGCGIYCDGAFDAKDSHFLPYDENSHWKNITISSSSLSTIENCTFKKGSGRALKEYENSYIYKYFRFVDDIVFASTHGERYSDIELKDFFDETYGGALCCINTSVTGCNFYDCYSDCDGGSINAAQNTTIRHCKFYNSYSEGDGGAVYLDSGSIVNSEFYDCLAKDSGGAVRLGNYANIKKCQFIRCHAYNNGGAICSESRNSIAHSLFKECSSKRAGAINGECRLYCNDFINCRGSFIVVFDIGIGRMESSRFLRCEAKKSIVCSLLHAVHVSHNRFYYCKSGESI